MEYQLFLITNDFTKSHVDESFHATVVAPTEAAARWIVAQQCTNLAMREVQAAVAFAVGKIDAPAEGIISFEYGRRNRFPVLSLDEYKLQDVFIEVELHGGIQPTHSIHPPVPGAVVRCFASKEHPRIVLIRSTLKTTVPTVVEEVGVTNEATSIQLYTVHSPSAYTEVPKGEVFTTEYINLFGREDVLLFRSLIIRNTELAYQNKRTEELLHELQSFFAEGGDRNSMDAGISYYPGQKLTIADPSKLVLWVMSLPQVITLDRIITEESLKPIAGTNCQTLNTGE
ncbi:hypothetical protein pEaSNUABM42_00249 [Erwinia phage pEa_SNUABM_42]|nr:hypothetical protein pEaSNUABM43_00250 [Erwinia phage pEa_SNUABM_43]QVW55566.1 hypothetical protein pEaSNUABM42_00249 [Erwinia phage pEa_SNUABM_42]